MPKLRLFRPVAISQRPLSQEQKENFGKPSWRASGIAIPSRAEEILRPTEAQSSGSVLTPACQERGDGFAMACLGLLQTALP